MNTIFFPIPSFSLVLAGAYLLPFTVLAFFLLDYLFSKEFRKSGKIDDLFFRDEGFPNTETYSVVVVDADDERHLVHVNDKQFGSLAKTEEVDLSYCKGWLTNLKYNKKI